MIVFKGSNDKEMRLRPFICFDESKEKKIIVGGIDEHDNKIKYDMINVYYDENFKIEATVIDDDFIDDFEPLLYKKIVNSQESLFKKIEKPIKKLLSLMKISSDEVDDLYIKKLLNNLVNDLNPIFNLYNYILKEKYDEIQYKNKNPQTVTPFGLKWSKPYNRDQYIVLKNDNLIKTKRTVNGIVKITVEEFVEFANDFFKEVYRDVSHYDVKDDEKVIETIHTDVFVGYEIKNKNIERNGFAKILGYTINFNIEDGICTEIYFYKGMDDEGTLSLYEDYPYYQKIIKQDKIRGY